MHNTVSFCMLYSAYGIADTPTDLHCRQACKILLHAVRGGGTKFVIVSHSLQQCITEYGTNEYIEFVQVHCKCGKL